MSLSNQWENYTEGIFMPGDKTFDMFMTEKAWAREDSAVQRRVADLKAAGLNPVLAAGSAAGSMPPTSMKSGPLKDREKRLGMINSVMTSMQQKADISRTYAEQAYIKKQSELVDAQKQGIDWDNRFRASTYDARVDQENIAAAIARVTKDDVIKQMAYKTDKGWLDNEAQRIENEILSQDLFEKETMNEWLRQLKIYIKGRGYQNPAVVRYWSAWALKELMFANKGIAEHDKEFWIDSGLPSSYSFGTIGKMINDAISSLLRAIGKDDSPPPPDKYPGQPQYDRNKSFAENLRDQFSPIPGPGDAKQ